MNTTLYDTDYNLWLDRTISLLKEKRFEEIELPQLIEEMQALSGKDKSAIASNLIIVILHLLKYQYQPQKRTNSWLSSIAEHRDRIEFMLEASPSLKPYLNSIWIKCYWKARNRAGIETGLPLNAFPFEPPFSLLEVLNSDYL